MRHWKASLIKAAALAPLVAACHGTGMRVIVLKQPIELARSESGAGAIEVYKLDDGGTANGMVLLVQSSYPETISEVGMKLAEIDKEFAQKHFLRPFSGLFIEEVSKGSSADEAGILPGDILLGMNGVNLIYVEQAEHLIKSLPPEAEIPVRIRRAGSEEVTRLIVRTQVAQRMVESASSISFEDVVEEQRYAGLILGTLPAQWSAKIYGEDEPAVLVGGVYLGSPAWEAGLRAGQRILAVDGRCYQRADAVRARLQRRGRAGESAVVSVAERDGARRELQLALEEYRGEVDIDIPLIFNVTSDHLHTDWELGPFGWLMEYRGGFDRRDGDETSRSYGEKSRFAMLLNLFTVRSSSVHGSEVTLLWFINIDVD